MSDWSVLIGPFPNVFELADAMTKLSASHDWELNESPDRMGLAPTYSLLAGRFESKEEAESAASLIHDAHHWRTNVTPYMRPHRRDLMHPSHATKFVKEMQIRRADGVPTISLHNFVEAEIAHNPTLAQGIRRTIFSTFKDSDWELAQPFGVEYAVRAADPGFFKVFESRMIRNDEKEVLLDVLLTRLDLEGHRDDGHLILELLFELRVNSFFPDPSIPPQKAVNKLAELLNPSPWSEVELAAMLFTHLQEDSRLQDLRIGLAMAYQSDLGGDGQMQREIARLHNRRGDIRAAANSIESHIDDRRIHGDYRKYRSWCRLLDHGWTFPPKAPMPIDHEEQSVCYLAHTSLPHHSSGYATRTHNLLRALSDGGWRVRCLTRHGYPWRDLGLDAEDADKLEMVDGIAYHHTQLPEEHASWDVETQIEKGVEALVNHCRQVGIPALLHAASNWMNGVVGVHAARILGIPSVYEVRGLWELTRLSREPEFDETGMYETIVRMETEAAKGADKVIVITEALREILIQRGVPADRIELAPNGVDTERFSPLEQDESLRLDLALPDGPVVGYVGSIVPYEGLDHLINAVERLRSEGSWRGSVLIVGDGQSLPALREQVEAAGLGDVIRFTGRVDFKQVQRYYSLIDIAPFPRLPFQVCEVVSPLKPFEAMAMGRIAIASDVAALAEIIEHNVNGLLFRKGSVASLAEVLEDALDRVDSGDDLGLRARNWVEDHRTWRDVAGSVEAVWKSVKVSRRPTLLIAGHDLKFIQGIGRGFIHRGFSVMTDNWTGHNQHDAIESERLLRCADIVICEWALGNAVWFSNHVQSHQRLFIRFHRQEIETSYPDSIHWPAVDRIIFIAPHVKRDAIERFSIPPKRTRLIPNGVDVNAFNLQKNLNSTKSIGMMGVVPRMKRLDRGLDILRLVREEQPEAVLRIKGKRPEEYEWMLAREEEMEWYASLFHQIETDGLLKGAVIFDGFGDDVPEWFTQVGHLISVSDFEGSHQAVAEAGASGAVPTIVSWRGADEVYPEAWVVQSIQAAASRILADMSDEVFENNELRKIRVQDHIRAEFDLPFIVDAWVDEIGIKPRRRHRKSG